MWQIIGKYHWQQSRTLGLNCSVWIYNNTPHDCRLLKLLQEARKFFTDPFRYFFLSFSKLICKERLRVATPLKRLGKQCLPNCRLKQSTGIFSNICALILPQFEFAFDDRWQTRIVKQPSKIFCTTMQLNSKFTKKLLPFVLLITTICCLLYTSDAADE